MRPVTYASAKEAICTASLELLKARGEVSAAELRLLLSVKLAFCAKEAQQRQILQEALMLVGSPFAPPPTRVVNILYEGYVVAKTGLKLTTQDL